MIQKTKIAHLLVKLENLKDQLNNEILPLLEFTHLDDQIKQSAESLAEDINVFINRHEVIVRSE